MTRVSGTKRTAMQRAADSQKIVKIILKSLDYEPVTVQRLSEEFGVDRHSIRDDISIWLEAYGHEDPVQTEALLNWRDSHVAPQALRDQYVELAQRLFDERGLEIKECAEALGVDRQALSYWMKRAGVSANAGTGTRQVTRFTHATGDLTLSELLEEQRLNLIKDARESIADQLAIAEAL